MNKLKYKIYYADGGGSNVPDILDHNLDINIVFEDGRVFVITFFTLANVGRLMNNANDGCIFHFWASDMVIIRDMLPETIECAVREMVASNHIQKMGTYIGTLNEVFSGRDKLLTFDTFPHMASHWDDI